MSRIRSASPVSNVASDDASVSSGTVPTPKFELAKTIPQEMMPILTLLHAQKQRNYYEGYFMILNDLNSGMLPIFHFFYLCACLECLAFFAYCIP